MAVQQSSSTQDEQSRGPKPLKRLPGRVYTPKHEASALVTICAQGSEYDNDIRRQAVILYVETGKQSLVARQLGLTEATVSRWKDTDWWDSAAEEVVRLIDNETRAQLRDMTRRGLEVAYSKLGDEKTTAQQAAVVASIGIDKLRLIDNKPTRITGDGRVDGLAQQLEQLSQQVNARIVSEQ